MQASLPYKLKILARAETTISHPGSGPHTTNVDLSAYGLPAITKCIERFLGLTTSVPTSTDWSAYIRLTSPTNLEIVTQAGAGGTFYVSWELQQVGGRVQRGLTDMAVPECSRATANVAINKVNMARSRLFHNGRLWMVGLSGYLDPGAVQLTSATNITVAVSLWHGGTVRTAWAIDGG